MGRTTDKIVTVAAIGLLASACTGGSTGKTEGLPVGHGGTLRVVLTRSGGTPYLFGDYDPQVSGDAAALEVERCCLFRTLLSYNGQPTDGGGTTPRPDLAVALPEVSQDGLTWTFHLKQGIHYAPPFQNREIVAQDVIRGLERALLPLKGKEAMTICGVTRCQLSGYIAQFYTGLIRGAQQYANGEATTISGLEAPDPQTLRVRVTHPSGTVAYLFALDTTAPIPPKPGNPSAPLGAAQGHDLDYGRGFPVASGPYMVRGSGSIDFSLPPAQQKPAGGAAKDSFALVRNPSWDPATDDLRVAYADRIVITGVRGGQEVRAVRGKDLATGERMVERDQADIVGDFTAPPPLVERFQRSPTLRNRVVAGSFDVVMTMTLNLASPPLDDVHVRRAINFAVDKVPMRPIIARYVSNSTVAAHVGLDSEEDNLLLNYAPFGTGEGDPRAAAAEMAKSKYDTNGDGKCDALVCRGVELIFPADDPARTRFAALIKADLAPLGIDVAVRPAGDNWRQLTSDPSSRVPMNLVSYVKDFPSASDLYLPLFSSRTLTDPTGGGDPSLLGATPTLLRKWGYGASSVPNVDARMNECDEQTFRAQVTCWASFDQYLTQTVVPWVPLLSWTGAYIVSSRVVKLGWDQSTPFPSAALDRLELKRGS
jgi:peptide/nickel transport system substrate-binding protein